MAEEKKDKKEEVKEKAKEVAPVVEKPVVEKPEVEEPAISKDVIDGMIAKQTELEKDVKSAKGASEKISKIAEVLTGEESKEARKERLFTEFAEDPEGTLEKYAGNKSKVEISEIRKTLRDIQLEKADNEIMKLLFENDPDYRAVRANMLKLASKEEYEKYAGDESRFEILYGLTKSRMAGKIESSKAGTEEAKNKAVEESNKTAVSEKPGSTEVEEPTERDKRDEEIAKARHAFDSDKVAKLATERLLDDVDFLKKWDL